jgi:hypothetical protein
MIFGKVGDISADGSAKSVAKLVFTLPPPTLLITKSSAIHHPSNPNVKSAANAVQAAMAKRDFALNLPKYPYPPAYIIYHRSLIPLIAII